MSFGWSVGDIIAGIKVVWDIWEAVSDGALSAPVEATQFLEDFAHITGCLEDCELRARSAQDARLSDSYRRHQQLKEECIVFVRRHRELIQEVNPRTRAIKEGHTTWLTKAKFTREQIILLYEKTQWPFERKEVARLQEKLQRYLQIAIYRVSASTNTATLQTMEMVRDMRASNAELLSSNLKLVSSHLDLVSLVTLNLKRVTYPLESAPQENRIDYPMLRQFEQALLPPAPLRTIEGSSRQPALPWVNSGQRELEEARYGAVLQSSNDTGPFDQNGRGLLSERLDNLSMRFIRRVETVDTISSTGSRSSISPDIQSVLERLRDMRNQIGDAVGIPSGAAIESDQAVIDRPNPMSEPQSALQEELVAWNQLEDRIQYEILHPGHLGVQAAANSLPPSTAPISIPSARPPRSSISVSPLSGSPPRLSSSSGSFGPIHGSPEFNDHSWQIPRNMGRPISTNRAASISSSSSFYRLDRPLPCYLEYPKHKISGTIQAISRFENGDVQSITTLSQDGLIEFSHSVDLVTAAAVETSMKPFLDNGHIDKAHKYRVQFQGAHILTIAKNENQGQRMSRIHCPPKYTLPSEKDFLEFQSLLLQNKEVKHCIDFNVMKCTRGNVQSRLGNLRILLDPDPIYRMRSILYFRKTNDPKPGFVEWPVGLFKEPKEPSSNCKSLSLESVDGRTLSISRGLSRRSTQGSITTIGSFESTAVAYSRLQDRSSSGKPIKGLVVEFYDAIDCHRFWEEFTKKEFAFQDSGISSPAEPS